MGLLPSASNITVICIQTKTTIATPIQRQSYHISSQPKVSKSIVNNKLDFAVYDTILWSK